MKLWVLKLKLI